MRSALALTSLAAMALAWSDSYTLQSFSVPPWEAARASAATSLLIALVSLPLAWTVATLFGPPARRLATSLWEQPARLGPRYLTIGAALLLLGGATYGGLLFAQTRFASAAVHRVALTLIVVSVGGGIALTTKRTEQWMVRRLSASSPRAARLWVVGFAVAAPVVGAGMVFLAAQPVLEELELRPAGSMLGVVSLALVGFLMPGASKARVTLRRVESFFLWVGSLLAITLVGFAAWFACLPQSPSLRLAVHLRPTASSWLLRQLSASGTELPSPAHPAADRSAVCWPEVEPPTSSIGRASAEAPDIVLLTVDAVRWDHTSLSGYARDTTPLLAARAKNAVVFERAYASASSTRQSVRGLFTGVYSSLVYNVRTPGMQWGMGFTSEQVTWAEYLRDAGYETVAYSAMATVFSQRNGALDGFQEVDESAVKVRRERGHTADYFVDLVLARLSRPRTKPRFIWAHVMDPHEPYPSGPTPMRFGDEHVDRYDSALHYTDSQIDRLLEHVEANASANTWVFLTADHGEAFREHGLRRHGRNVYNEEIQVPLLFWGPGVVPRRISTPVSLIDLLPTALDVAGLEPPAALCGQSLRPILEGAEPTPRVVYSENVPDHARTHLSVGLVEGDQKVVVRPMAGTRELYDVVADPGEIHDLSESKPDDLADRLETLRRFYRQHGLDAAAYGL